MDCNKLFTSPFFIYFPRNTILIVFAYDYYNHAYDHAYDYYNLIQKFCLFENPTLLVLNSLY